MSHEAFGTVQFTWHFGAGFWMLVLATLIKIPDAVYHIVLPTPSERWEKPVGPFKSVADYMYVDSATVPHQMCMDEDEDEEEDDDNAEDEDLVV